MSLSRPHDALFHAAMSDPRRAAELLRLVLPKTLFGKLDAPSLRIESGTYHDKSLAETQSDLLLSARYGALPMFIYILLEHKSHVDRWVLLQMLGYLVRIWEDERKRKTEHRAERTKARDITLSPILPILISHAEGGWTGPVRFSGLFGSTFDTHPELVRWLPDYQVVLEDLDRRDDSSLLNAGLDPSVLLTLVSLRDGRREHIADTLRRYTEQLKALAQLRDRFDLFDQIVTYLVKVAQHLTYDAIHAILLEVIDDSEDIMPTIAEQFLAKGRAEGETAVLRKQLSRKFGALSARIEERLSTAIPQDLESWAERILTATTIEEVFTDNGAEPH